MDDTQQKFSSGALFHLHQQQYNGPSYTVVWMKGGFNPDESGILDPNLCFQMNILCAAAASFDLM